LLTIGRKKIYDLPAAPYDLAVCENQIIVACGYTILIYDHDFNLIENIDQIELTKLFVNRIQVDLNQRIFYLCDHFDSKVIATDFDFNHLRSKRFETDAQPIDISFVNNSLYVLDCVSRLSEYSRNFNLIRYLDLDEHPERIKISDSTICVLSRHDAKVFDVAKEQKNDMTMVLKFFNLKDFSLIRKINSLEGKLSLINSVFYYCINKANGLCSYDEQGLKLNDFFIFDNLKDDHCLFLFFECNGSILVPSYNQQKIYKFYD